MASIDLISKKTNCTCSTLLFSNQQKNKFARAARFLSFFAVVLHNYDAVLQDYNVKLPSYTLFLWRNFRICLPNILSPVFMFAFIFHCPSFSPCWAFLAGRQHFSLSHRRFEFFCFSSTKFGCSSFSVIHVNVNVKNNIEKYMTLYFALRAKCWVRGGVGGQFPRSV